MQLLHPAHITGAGLLFLASLAAFPADAQWSTDPNVNNAICTAYADQNGSVLVDDGAGGAIIVWLDNRNGPSVSPDLYAQRVDAQGVAQWPIDGVPICTAGGGQIGASIITDGAGGAIIAWLDYRFSPNWTNISIYAQRVSAKGEVLWSANGVPVVNGLPSPDPPVMASDGAGGAIVTWTNDNSSTGDLFAQRINGNGVVQWANGGIPICTAPTAQMHPAIVNIGSGKAIIAWQDYRAWPLGGYGTGIYAQAVNANGIVLWAANGIPLCAASGGNRGDAICAVSDGKGEATVFWTDQRAGSSIYAQRVNGAGAVQWTTDGVALTGQSAGLAAVNSVVSDDSGGAIVTWNERRNGADDDIFAQRITKNGSLKWGSGGTTICAASADQQSPTLTADGASGAIIRWQDLRNSTYPDIYAQRVDAQGRVQWMPNGVAISTAPGIQGGKAIISDGAGGALISWEDRRNGANYDIYAERVNSSGLLGNILAKGSLAVTVQDAENWGLPGGTAQVHLFGPDDHLMATEPCNASSVASFTDVPAGTGYSYSVENSINTPGSLTSAVYWGRKNGNTIAAGQTTTDTFIRNTPYAPSIVVFNNLTNENVGGKTVQGGTLLRIEIQAKNPSYAGSLSQQVKTRLTLDTNRIAPLEVDYWSAAQTISPGQMATTAFYYQAQTPGRFYQAGALTVPVSGVDTYVECFSDYSQPLFTVLRPAVMVLTPPDFTVGAESGHAFTRVTNSGEVRLTWMTTDNASWLHSNSQILDTIEVAYDANTSSASRTGTVTISSNATNSPLTITLTQAGVQDSCPPPKTVVLLSPVAGEVFTTDTVNLLWHTSGPKVSAYCLEVLVDSARTFVTDSTVADTLYTLRNLERGRSYLWRVKAKNPTGWGANSSWGHFSRMVGLPAAVSLLAPQDWAASAGDSACFRWHTGTPAVTRYWLEMALDSSFSFRYTDSSLVDTALTRRSLQAGVKYFWHVRAGNAAGWGPFSPAWCFSLTTTGVASQRLGKISSYQLYQNYPNPFNPSTMIRFDLPEPCRVRLSVYDMLGQEVIKLLDESVQAGMHEVRLDASGLPSGLYFYRLRAGSFADVKRLIVCK